MRYKIRQEVVLGSSKVLRAVCRGQPVLLQGLDHDSLRQGFLDNCLRFELVRIPYKLPTWILTSKQITSLAIQFKLIDLPIW